MTMLLKKIKQHGIKKSYAIAKYKFSALIKSSKIKLNYYSFLSQKTLLNKSNQKLSYFINKKNLNTEINFPTRSTINSKLDNIFFLLGKDYAFNSTINWHFNSDNIRKSYPNEISNKFSILDFEKFGDYRITWELNRHHHFVWYAQNFYLTNHEQFCDKLFSELNHWVKNNNVGIGINYVSPMEISIRLINWLFSIIIISSNHDIKNRISPNLIDNILGQLRYLNQNLFIKRKFRNNHSIVELAGLILYQSILDWKKLDKIEILYQQLFKELDDQFYEDGINFEHSPTYTRFTIESLLVLLIFVNNVNLKNQRTKLYDLVHNYVKTLRKFVAPDNSVPLFSDCDNGRILFLSGTNKDFNDFKGFFDFCGILFEDKSLFISKSIDELDNEVKWWSFLANIEPRVPSQEVSDENSSFFPNGGYFILNKKGTYFSFKSGYLGNRNINEEYAPHVHNDLLSFELYMHNQKLLVDSGTYTYNLSDNDFRNYFRSPYAHNTIILNGKNQLEHNEAFGAKNLPKANIKMITDNHVEGYYTIEKDLLIKRSVIIDEYKIEFTDSIKGIKNQSNIEINLNFHPDVKLNVGEGNEKEITISTKTKNFILEIVPIPEFKYFLRKELGWVSDYYNIKYNNEKLIITIPEVNQDINIRWFIKTIF